MCLKKPWSYPGACIIRLSCLLATSLYGFLIFFKPGVDKKSAYCIFLSIFDPTKLTRKFATEAGESIGHSGQIFRQKIYYHYFLQRMLFSCGAFETEKSEKKKKKKKQSKKFREDEVFQGSLVFEINLYGQGQIWRQKRNRSPWFRIQKKKERQKTKNPLGRD